MRVLFTMSFPTEAFNALERDGVVEKKMGAILEATKPESIYFTGNEYGRGAVAVYDVADGSQIPAVAEPWMLSFSAKIVYGLAITPDELMRSNLGEIVQKWG